MTIEGKAIEIPFRIDKRGYTIPEGMEAEIKDGKVIIKKAESEDERIRMALYEFISDTLGDEFDGYDFNKGEALAYLEKQKAKEEKK